MNGVNIMKKWNIINKKMDKALIEIICRLQKINDKKVTIDADSVRIKMACLCVDLENNLIDIREFEEIKNYLLNKIEDIENEKDINKVYKKIENLLEDLHYFFEFFTDNLNLIDSIMEKLDISN